MKNKSLLFFALMYSASSISYGSYTPFIAGRLPLLEESQQDYKAYLSSYKQWIETGYSVAEGQKYSHLSNFKKEKEDLESPTPHTIITAKRFFIAHDKQVEVASYTFSLPHLLQTSPSEKDKKGYHYLEKVFYSPLHQTLSYKLPALEGVEGLERELSYQRNNYILPGQELEIEAFNFTEAEHLTNGYYQSRLFQEKPHSYIYSSGTDLFLMHYHSDMTELVNHPDVKVNFNFLFKSKHKMMLKPGYTTNNVNGFFPQGVYINRDSQQPEQWQKVKSDLSFDSQELYLLSHAEGSPFQTIDLDPDASNSQVLKDLSLSFASKLIDGLDFKGRVFGQEKAEVINLLTSMQQLKSLNLSKEDETVNYNDLVPTLLTLTNLKTLNLTKSQITEKGIQELGSLKGLDIIYPRNEPAPAPEATVPAVNPEAPATESKAPVPEATAPATQPVVPPVETTEPPVEPTPAAGPTTPAIEPIVSTTEVPAVTIAAPAVALTEGSTADPAQ